MEYLKRAKAIHAQLFPPQAADVIPCTMSEVDQLERQIGMALPAAYREFLLWMGKGGGDFWIGLGGFYDRLPTYNEWARELVRESNAAIDLPRDAFVFFWDDAQLFYFFRTSEGDDPPVYVFMAPYLEELVRQTTTPSELSPAQQYAGYVFVDTAADDFVLRSERYSDCLESELREHARIRRKSGHWPTNSD